MSLAPRDIYDISRDRAALAATEAAFPNFLKLRSICWLMSIGAATTEGIVIANPTTMAINSATQYAKARGWNAFLLRHDAPRGKPRFEQGGFLIGTEEIEPWVRRYAHDGVCMLLEPLDPLLNGYNISCLVGGESPVVEIVGPGFDASDLQRGQVQPHEIRRLNANFKRFGPPTICTKRTYSESLRIRERKIWWKLIHHEPSATRWYSLSPSEKLRCRKAIRKSRGMDLPRTYQPIPSKLRTAYLRAAEPLFAALRAAFSQNPMVIAGSFVQDKTFKFWDVSTSGRWLSPE